VGLVERAHSGVRRLLPTLLFVDDDMLTLSTYRRSFQGDEFVSEFSLSGNQALTRINSANPPAAVVCDVMMPNIDGLALYSQVVAIDPSWRRRFVFVTGADGADSLRRSLEHFEGAFLKKPVSEDDLRRAIHDCLLNARVLLPQLQSG
jgi:CheY-like chemotaxis protein